MSDIASIKLKINEKIFVRDPEQTELGRKIIKQSIDLIDEVGFEKFTFKKLAERIHSTEASVYRYFENKHKLLIYLANWYWSWLEYQVNYQIHNIENPEKRLRVALRVIAGVSELSEEFQHIDKQALYRIIMVELPKASHTKEVDADNRDGFFKSYKSLCKCVAIMVQEVDSTYQFPHTLVSMCLESVHQQIFFSKHLPSLTDLKIINGNYEPMAIYLEDLVFRVLRPSPVR